MTQRTLHGRSHDELEHAVKVHHVGENPIEQEYLGRGKNEIPLWVFLSPGNIIWEEGKQVGRTEGQPVDMVNFRNRVFLKACDHAKICWC